jgi:hypothetical protein
MAKQEEGHPEDDPADPGKRSETKSRGELDEIRVAIEPEIEIVP